MKKVIVTKIIQNWLYKYHSSIRKYSLSANIFTFIYDFVVQKATIL